MASMHASIHVAAEDKIEARRGDTSQWVTIGEIAIFAPTADLERIKAAIDGVIAMRAPLAEAA